MNNNNHLDRRSLLTSMGAISLGLANITKVKAATHKAPHSNKLKITMAGYNFDRCAALVDGRVTPQGCDIKFVQSSIGKMNTHVFSGPQSYDVTEIGLSPFMLAYANEGFRDYTLIPVFPLRVFRHKSIFIRNDRGIHKPEDLRGKRIATAGYSSTSLTWIRGCLQHEYGVKPSDIQWFVSAKDSSAGVSGGPSQQESIIPDDFTMNPGPAGKDESAMLADGDVDAVFHAAEPQAYIEGHPNVARLFPDYRQAERAYYAKTGLFPIMHAVAMRRDVIDAHPWLPESIFNAYSQAKQLAYQRIQKLSWAFDSLPWIGQEFEETRALMGDNFWPYGIEVNRKALESLFLYSYEQGLARQRLTIEELFHPSTLDLLEG